MQRHLLRSGPEHQSDVADVATPRPIPAPAGRRALRRPSSASTTSITVCNADVDPGVGADPLFQDPFGRPEQDPLARPLTPARPGGRSTVRGAWVTRACRVYTSY